MGVTLLVSFALILVVIIFVLTALSRRKASKSKNRIEGPQPVPRGQPVRRAAGTRNARRRMHANEDVQVVRTAVDRPDEESNDEVEEKKELTDGKIGAKKRAKLEAKAEKKVQREAIEREREERKRRDQLLQEERDRQNEKEREEEMQKEEAERKAREEKEKREHEEYLRMKEAFSVEEEGYEESDAAESKNLMQEFLEYIKENKVVVLEDLSAHFRMKTVNVIDRIQDLQENGNLTGVIDDRGKFIYISQDELEAVAKFVRQRGRVSIAELAENSNRLINLNPGNSPNIIDTR